MANQIGYFSAGLFGVFLPENTMKFCICQSINFLMYILQKNNSTLLPSEMKMKHSYRIRFVQLGFCFYVSTFLKSVSYKLDTSMTIFSFIPLHNFKF